MSWLFPVVLFLKGGVHVMCLLKLTVTFKKKNLFEDPGGNPMFKCIFKLIILLCFVIFFFHRRDYIKEVWSNSETGASACAHPGCLVADCSSGGTSQLLPIALRGCGEVCLSSAGNRKFPVCGNHPVYAQADRHWVFKEYRYPRKLLLLYMERYEWISLCTPCYTLCTFVLLLSIKIGLL